MANTLSFEDQAIWGRFGLRAQQAAQEDDRRDGDIMAASSQFGKSRGNVALACWGLDEAEFSDILHARIKEMSNG